ncbi:MAG: hypothetical protein ACXU86_04015 [Archangium sp.]
MGLGDPQNLQVHSRPTPHDRLPPVSDAVTLGVTQAVGPGGHDLAGFSDMKLNGYPAISLLIRTPEGREGVVHPALTRFS